MFIMAWSKSRTQKRIEERKKSKNDYFVTEHKKEMDFSKLGCKEIRKVDGIHHYFDISNFPKLVADAKENEDKQKKILQKAHVFRKGLADVIIDSESDLLQDQNLRTHYLRTKPYSDKNKMAMNSVTEAITLNSFVYDVFNQVFNDNDNFRARSGMALGITYIANIGKIGNRELISLGNAANYGAKLLNNDGSISINSDIYKNLKKELQDIFSEEKLENGTIYYLTKQARWSKLVSLKDTFKIKFNEEKYKNLLEQYKKELPISEIKISDARTAIDIDSLSERNTKRTHTISLVADIDGFTNYIEEAENDKKVTELFALFSGIREELHNVIEIDGYQGVVVQHRGDATYSFLNIPCDKDKKNERCNNATSMALALQSSMELINEIYEDYDDLHLSIGEGSGLTLYSRVGKQGQKHQLIVGKGNEESEKNQMETKGKNISINKSIYDLLEEDLVDLFEVNGNIYTAYNKSLTYDIDKEKDRLKKNLKINIDKKKINISISKSNSQPEVNSGPWRK